MSKGSELSAVEQVLPTYLPQLVTLAQRPAEHQRAVAQIAAQGKLLAGISALHRDNLQETEEHFQQAARLSTIAKNHNLYVAAFIRLSRDVSI